jgi:hypothetical protein
MDNEERIAKVEAAVDNLTKDIDRLYDAIERLRQHTDNGFAEIRSGLEAQRKEASTNTRWMISLMLAMATMIAGTFAKVFGLY